MQSRRGRLLVAALSALAAAAVGCSAGSSSSFSSTATTAVTAATSSATSSPEATPSASASATPGVAPASLQTRCGIDKTVPQPLPVPFTFTAADGTVLLGVEFGTGPRGVVALHQLGRAGLCGWVSTAVYLAGKGLHVLVFDDRCVGLSTCPQAPAQQGDLLSDASGAQAELLRRGATTTALLGASQGGGVAVAAAGSQPGWSRAVVLSGALFYLDFGGGVTSTSAMPHVTVPTLFAVAEGDPDSPIAADQALVATAPPGVVQLDVLPEGGHGWSLLQGYPGGPFAPLVDQVAAFLLA